MKNQLTELVFILDKSGSMSGLEKDTIGGFNSMVKKQMSAEGECIITTVLFDNHYELLHDRIPLQAVSSITEEDYCVGGSTALLDAMGKTIHKIEMVQKNTSKEYRAGNVMFVIITDGEENASRHYSFQQIKKMVQRHKKKDDWEFIFLGANMDAVEAARTIGIEEDRAVEYLADEKGTTLNFEMMSRTVESFRKNGSVPDACLDEIRLDRKRRG